MPPMRLTAILLAGAFAVANPASGQTYPAKPLRIMTQPVGGGTDFASRLIAEALSTSLGQPVVVDNRPGTASIEAVAKAPADGYTMLLYANGMWTEPFLRENVRYDPVRDFSPLTQVAASPNILIVHPSLPVRSVRQLIQLARSRPGQLNYSSAGGGTPNHLAAELFKAMAHVAIVHVTYKGTGPALTGLMSGEVQVAFPNAAGAAPLVKAGRVRALAVTSAKESTLYAGLPTVASVLPGYESIGIVAMFVVAKTPDAIITRLNDEIVRALNRPDVKDRFLKSGVEVVGSTPGEAAMVIKADMTKWGRLIKEANIRQE